VVSKVFFEVLDEIFSERFLNKKRSEKTKKKLKCVKTW